MKYFNEKCETLSRDELRALQNERLIKQIRHVWDHNPLYRKKMEDCALCPDDIKSIDDLVKLPFTEKEDLRQSYPNGFLSVDRKDCVEIHSTSGTTGKRVIAYYTKNDVDFWHESCARALAAAGADNTDVVQICFGYGLFTGGAGLDGGSHKLGCLTMPMSSGNTDRQLQFMQDMGTTVLCCTPSYAMYLSDAANEAKVKDSLKLKSAILGAEAWTQSMRKKIEESFKIKAYDIYGLTELMGPGVAYECECQNGMHINEDFFIPEIIDPKTGKTLDYGQEGELVFTSLTKEAFPVIRYRTKDICVLHNEKCECGRTFVKMEKPKGRTDDMLIIRGVNVFPSQIEQVLFDFSMASNYRIIVDRVNNNDTLDIELEMTPELMTDMLSKISIKQNEISSKLQAVLGIKANVRIVAPYTLERTDGKVKRVIDRRKLYDN